MKRIPISHYSFGMDAPAGSSERFSNAAECAKHATAEGYSFIMGHYQNGDKIVLALNNSVQAMSKEEALEKYRCDGDKRAILSTNKKIKVWIIAPMGVSDLLIPFSGRIRAFKLVKPEELH